MYRVYVDELGDAHYHKVKETKLTVDTIAIFTSEVDAAMYLEYLALLNGLKLVKRLHPTLTRA